MAQRPWILLAPSKTAPQIGQNTRCIKAVVACRDGLREPRVASGFAGKYVIHRFLRAEVPAVIGRRWGVVVFYLVGVEPSGVRPPQKSPGAR